uniref:Hematopoietic cell signal transducer n=1 Tax=Monopterus albus TaxID=43700 RepID=A0A3Q3Q1A6_MONAL
MKTRHGGFTCIRVSPNDDKTLGFTRVLLSSNNTVSCYRIEPGTIAGIICADVLLTVIIVIVTYRCAGLQRKKIKNADKVYMNVRANCKS